MKRVLLTIHYHRDKETRCAKFFTERRINRHHHVLRRDSKIEPLSCYIVWIFVITECVVLELFCLMYGLRDISSSVFRLLYLTDIICSYPTPAKCTGQSPIMEPTTFDCAARSWLRGNTHYTTGSYFPSLHNPACECHPARSSYSASS